MTIASFLLIYTCPSALRITYHNILISHGDILGTLLIVGQHENMQIISTKRLCEMLYLFQVFILDSQHRLVSKSCAQAPPWLYLCCYEKQTDEARFNHGLLLHQSTIVF